MRTFFVICFALGVVSSLPIQTDFPEKPVLPKNIDSFDNDVVKHYPRTSEVLTSPVIPEDEIDGVEPDSPVQPEMPKIPIPDDTIEIEPNLVTTSEQSSQPEDEPSENESVIPDFPEIPIMVEHGIEERKNINMRNQIRPGMQVTNYAVEIEPNSASGTFSGRLVATVIITDPNTLADDVAFYVRDLNINSVMFSIAGGTTLNEPIRADVDDGLLLIETGAEMSLYTFIIEYTGTLSNMGSGVWEGDFEGLNYLAMNLHPTHARGVFPCMDELTESSIISFTFNNLPYNNIFMNSGTEDNTVSQFKALQGPALLWGMVAHNFNNINNPHTNVQLYARPGLFNQENQASLAINFYYNNLEEWTLKPYQEIVLDQDGRMYVIALPDVHKDWYALSTVCIWEPYILMERQNSVKQTKEALNEIAEAVARQWYGYVIYPENWRFQWVVQGLASHTAYELNRAFQSSYPTDPTAINYNEVFVSDVIQEALYRDGYAIARPLEPDSDIFDEIEIREHLYGHKLLKYKAPAMMWMLKLMLGDENEDFIQSAGRILLNSRSLDTVNSRFFIDAINAEWLPNGNGIVGDLREFLEPWLQANGYPVLHVSLRTGGVLLSQEKFSFSDTNQVNYLIPITWTTSVTPDFSDNNIRPAVIMDGSMTINMALGDEDFPLFNIQGQGYYRVNYADALWERIIEALGDRDARDLIHPLNRATLVDDALNLARAGMLDYEIAFQVVLTMEHEIEYAPWKAFVRNMNFLRRRLLAYVDDEDDLDPDIYLRMVRRTVGRVEDEIGFYPDFLAIQDSDVAMTRGLVMDHACRAGYRPCIAAAVDWFWDPDGQNVVNPSIPHEIRPAVFCTMVREGGNDIINALYARLEIEPVMYERVVILESLACSQDTNFILTFLGETIATNSPYSVEERNRIFKAVVESSYANTFTAISFISQRFADMRRMYGGDEKVEEIIWHLAENVADGDHAFDFQIWVNSVYSGLDESEDAAQNAQRLVVENLAWDNAHLEYVYEWIDDNDAPTLVVSLTLILGSFFIAIFNQ